MKLLLKGDSLPSPLQKAAHPGKAHHREKRANAFSPLRLLPEFQGILSCKEELVDQEARVRV